MVSMRFYDIKSAVVHLIAWCRQGEGVNRRIYMRRKGPNVLTTSLYNILFSLDVHVNLPILHET